MQTEEPSTSAYETILVERDGPVAVVTLNRPKVLNALNAKLIAELGKAFAALDADRGVRAIVLTGSGERAFAAGADISELNAVDGAPGGVAVARLGQGLTLAMDRMRTPIVVAVNGFALGGGCELAMGGDIRIASENARFGQPEVNLGLLPGYGGTQRTTRLLGRGMAMYLCLTGEMIDAPEALRTGLVQKVVPLELLREEALRIAKLIASKAPLAVAATKEAINAGAGLSLADGLEIEALHFGTLVATADYREGTSAFLEKRPANFTGK
jgi:enoyl-CoA hydratase